MSLFKSIATVGLVVFGVSLTYYVATSNAATGQSAPSTDEKKPTKVLSEKVQIATDAIVIHSQGVVNYRTKIDLVAEVAGTITAVKPQFNNGAVFEPQGHLLTIDQRDYQAALAIAHANLAQAQTQLVEEQGRALQAKREWRDLGDENANDLFTRKYHVKSAQALVNSSQSAVTKAKTDLARTQVKGPFNGRVVERFVGLGQYVSPGTPLAQVYDISVATVSLPVTAKQLNLINQTRVLGASVVLINGQNQWQAKVRRIGAEVERNTQQYQLIVEVDDPQGYLAQGNLTDAQAPLLPGLFVEAQLHMAPPANSYKVARQAIHNSNQIWLIGPDNKSAVLSIDILSKDKDFVWFSSTHPLLSQLLSQPVDVALNKHNVLVDGIEVTPVSAIDRTDVAQPSQEIDQKPSQEASADE